MLQRAVWLILLLVWSMNGFAQSCSSDWEIVNPKINLGNLSAITYGNNQFVAVGGAGRTARSSDGVNWTKSPTGKGSDLIDVAWGNGRYVAISYNQRKSEIFASADGENWSESASSSEGTALFAVAWSGARFVAVGYGYFNEKYQAVVADSLDGISWNFKAMPLNDTFLKDVAWDGGQFIAVGYTSRSDRPVGVLLLSRDGQNWESRYLEDAFTLDGIAAGASRRLIWGGSASASTSQVWYSDDAVTWRTGGQDNFAKLAWNGSRFLGSLWGGGILASADGITWETVQQFNIVGGITDFATGNGKTVAVGWGSEVYTSADGLNWETPLSVTTGGLSDVLWNGKEYVAVGFSGAETPLIVTSPDSTEWTQQKQGLENEQGGLRAVAWGNNRYVAVSDYSSAFVSSDGKKWQRVETHVDTGLLHHYQDVLWDGRQFILTGGESLDWGDRRGGNALFFTSADGSVWNQVNTNIPGHALKIIKVDNKLIGVGGYFDTEDSFKLKAMVVSSTDGQTWASQPLGIPGTLYGIAWNGSRFVAVGSKGCWWGSCYGDPGRWILTSADGVNWTPQDAGIPLSPGSNYQSLYNLVWNGSEFVALGDRGVIISSADGLNWQLRRSGTGQALVGLEWDGKQFIGTGANGTILRSKCSDTQAPQTGQYVTDKLWIRAVIQTEEKGPVEARWQLDGKDTTARGDKVMWGHFYADPNDVDWGNKDNPDLFVKIWFDVNGRIDVNYFHVSVPDIYVYTAHYGSPDKPDQYSATTVWQRYVRHYFQNGQSDQEKSQIGWGSPAEVPNGEGIPAGFEVLNKLRIGARIHTESAGVIDGQWRLGGSAKTGRGDEVAWGLFYADPAKVNWGSPDNPDVFVKVWFDFSGRIDVNYFHVSVPSIGAYSDYPADGTYDQAHMTGMSYRYLRHEFWR